MIARPSRLVLLGHPVSHSLSPKFQNAALRAMGIPLTYKAIDVAADSLAGTLVDLTAANAAGNVTIPHKEAVAALCTRLLPLAERTGAVNTFWVDDGQLVGDNTDAGGFDDAVRELIGEIPHRAVIAVLGAGGSAAGVLAAIEGWGGSRARVYNRTETRARLLVDRFPATATLASSPAAALADADLVVNATSVGLSDDSIPFALDLLPPGASLLDLVYRRRETRLVREVRARGQRAGGGLPMLIGQGARSFERWFGIAPDRTVMWEAVKDLI